MPRTADERRAALALGALAEARVAAALEADGWRVLARNWRFEGGELDLVVDLPLAETERSSFRGCPAGAAAELWKIRGGSHIPVFNASWADTIYTWLLAHPRP